MKGWYRHHRMEWVIIIKSEKWFDDNYIDLVKWLDSEDILQYNTIKKRIFLYSEEQLTYFTMRWS